MLLLIASVSSLSGLLLWSASPFVFNNPKDKFQVVLRYLSLFGSLGCGVSAIAIGHRLQRIAPLIRAIDTAERNDFLTALATSEYVQQQQWQQLALEPTTRPPVQINQVADSIPRSDQVQPESDPTSTGSLPTSQSSEVTGSEHFRSLWKSVSLLKEQGLSDTKIIEDVLGMSGRKFNEGKQMLEALIQLGQQQGW